VLRWLMLALGATLLLLVGLHFASMAAIRHRFGGIPWRADLVWANPFWDALFLCGLILVGLAASLFLHARHRPNSD